MKILQLYREGVELTGSDGILYVDGRFGIDRIELEVHNRNLKMSNYPHKIADAFAFYGGSIKNGCGPCRKIK